MSVQLSKEKKNGVINSPSMTGGTGWVVLAASVEDVKVRVKIYSDEHNGFSYDTIHDVSNDGPSVRVGLVGIGQSKVQFFLEDSGVTGRGVVDCSIIPNRSFT